jgi:Flp pilus assembly protein TadD
MKRILIATAALALTLGTVVANKRVHAAGQVNTPEPARSTSKTITQEIPEYLRPAPMKPLAADQMVIDIPVNGTIYPPEIIPPQFAWRDGSAATVWRIEIDFGAHSHPMKFWSNGEKMQLAPVDDTLAGYVPPTLTEEQAAAHTWRPDAKTWAEIKQSTVEQPATVTITGYANEKAKQPLSHSQAAISTSKDPVGAPLFFRDVPLLPPAPESEQRGVIKPLPDSVLPKIRWELRYISDTQSKTVMTGLPTCANCHSISRDGKTLGIDVDGPQNDKGLYALIPLKKNSSISNDYVIHWSAFSEERAQKRFGFMSQVSPDGKFVVTSIDVPHAHGVRVLDRLYNGFYSFYGFGQVFYPTRGVLGWYSKETGKLEPLPGADDPNFVQTAAFWSPDGKWIVFSRAAARDPYPAGQKKSTYANSPDETQIQYDLYRIPFNNGKGGTPERVVGASENGMSNNFPKVSPDGKWIVFVQCKNGLLMRPDSKLYIVPFEGGEARPLESNFPVMNSWHTFSPNGRWLAFSSKTPSFYTHLYLTHIDDNGHVSPPVVVENATASNRAVNIPEFMNIGPEDGPDSLEHIATPAMDFYKIFDNAVQLAEKRQYDAAVPVWKQAVQMDPDDARAYNNLGVALAATGSISDAVAQYKKSLELNPDNSQTRNNLGSVLAQEGKMDEALAEIRKAVEINPDNSQAHINLAHVLETMGGNIDEALSEVNKGIELAPKSPEGHNVLGVILARTGKLDQAIPEMQKAVEIAPNGLEFRFNLGRALAAASRFSDALPQFEAAAKLPGGDDPEILQLLAAMYSENAQYQTAVTTARHALDLAIKQNNEALADSLRANIARYEHQASEASAK